MIQLTPEEAEEYRKTPVIVDFRTGFYIFPVSHRSFKFVSTSFKWSNISILIISATHAV